MRQSVVIREMQPEDASAVAALSGELGYPAGEQEMRERIERLTASADHALLVACGDGRILGWIDASIVRHLASTPAGEIAGLVVASTHRSRGVGEQLIHRAEEWIASRGITRVVVRSRVARERAHQFYLRHGYTEWKRQAVFSKDFDAQS